MVSFGILIMVAAIAFCIGGLLGAVISRNLFPQEQRKLLEDSLRSSREELEKYQQDVTQHFAQTADLVNKLTQSYRDVHEHLAAGAVHLANADISREMLKSGSEHLGLESHNIDEAKLRVPRDWAPKKPGDIGALSETYGLDDDEDIDLVDTLGGSIRSGKKAL